MEAGFNAKSPRSQHFPGAQHTNMKNPELKTDSYGWVEEVLHSIASKPPAEILLTESHRGHPSKE